MGLKFFEYKLEFGLDIIIDSIFISILFFIETNNSFKVVY
jgi:hypothetical protein